MRRCKSLNMPHVPSNWPRMSLVGLEEGFISRLSGVISNVPELKDGAQIYRSMVKPSVVDLLRVGAHYAMTSLFENYPSQTNMYSYTVKSEQYDLKEAGRLKLAVGRAKVRSKDTWEESYICFAVLHLGDHNFIGGVDYLNADEFCKNAYPHDECFFGKRYSQCYRDHQRLF